MIRLPPFTYVAPRTVDAAARLLMEHGRDAMLMAGGTDLFPNMKRRQFEPKVLVAIRGIRELQGVRGSSGGWTIGAATTLSAVTAHQGIARDFPALATAAGLVSSPQIQNMGTIGGNVCVDTRCNYYNQSYEWRQAIGFCMKSLTARQSFGSLSDGGVTRKAVPLDAMPLDDVDVVVVLVRNPAWPVDSVRASAVPVFDAVNALGAPDGPRHERL
jgi:hypothetical protein